MSHSPDAALVGKLVRRAWPELPVCGQSLEERGGHEESSCGWLRSTSRQFSLTRRKKGKEKNRHVMVVQFPRHRGAAVCAARLSDN